MSNARHYSAAIIAFVGWGFFSIPLRALRQFPVGEILYFRILFSAALLLLIILMFKRKAVATDAKILRQMTSRQRLTAIGLTLAGGALLSVNWLTFIHMVNNINIKTASFSYLICPVLTAVLAFVLLGERLAAFQWAAVLICAVSCTLIGMESAVELGYSLFTAASYALYLVSQRKNQGFDRMVSLCVQVLFSIAILTAFFGVLVDEVPAEPAFYEITFVIAAFFTILPLFLNLYALNRIDSATIGILMYLNPLVNFSVAFFVFGETLTFIQLIGYSAIIFAIILFNYRNFAKMKMALKGQNE